MDMRTGHITFTTSLPSEIHCLEKVGSVYLIGTNQINVYIYIKIILNFLFVFLVF